MGETELRKLSAGEQAVVNLAVQHFLSGKGPATGKWLRAQLEKRFPGTAQELVAGVVPDMLTRFGPPPGDKYFPTLDGIIHSAAGPLAAKLIEDTLGVLRRKFADDPDFPTFLWSEVRQSCPDMNETLFQFAQGVVETSRLGSHGGVPAADEFRWSVPLDIEGVVRCTDFSEFWRLRRKQVADLREAARRNALEQGRELDGKSEILWSDRQLRKDMEALGRGGVFGHAVVFLDIDGFKPLNTKYSETMIDRSLLLEVQQTIRAAADHCGVAYRVGGDEFVVLLPNATRAMAIAFAESLRQLVALHDFDIGGDVLKITVSSGVCWAGDGPDGGDIRLRANLAMREAKKDRNRVLDADGPEMMGAERPGPE